MRSSRSLVLHLTGANRKSFIEESRHASCETKISPMNSGVLFYTAGAIAVFIVGLSKGGFAGIGIISTPLLAIVVGPVTAAGIMLPILIVQDVVSVVMYRRTFSRQILAVMIPGAACGIGLAYSLASTVSSGAVELVLGLISVVFSLHQGILQLRSRSARQQAPEEARWLGVLSGIGSGFTSMIAHAGSPPFQFYVMPKGLDRDLYVGTSVLFFAATNAMKVPAYYALGQLSPANLKTALVFIPLAIVSTWLGVRLVRTVDVRKFNVAINVILLGVGVILIGQGIVSLTGS